MVRGKQGVRVGGYLLPRGTRVEIHTYSMQRGWLLWGDEAEKWVGDEAEWWEGKWYGRGGCGGRGGNLGAGESGG